MNHHRLIRSAALGFALAALAAPTAGAQQQQDLRSPDTLDATQAVQTPRDLRSPDARDAAEGRGSYTSPQVVIVESQPRAQPTPADGLDRADAGIGAGSMLGLSLIGLGGALFIVHRRRAAHVAPPVAGL